jgi:hypothetical protein
MADINTNINVNVNTNGAEEALNKVGGGLDGLQTGQTRVTQSTRALTRETSSLNDGLLKNGGAMGLLGAATGGLAMDFKDAIEAIELTGVSLKGLRGAIIATGIGALAIVILELVTNWEKWSGVIDGSTAAMKSFNAQVEISNQKREESNRITNSAISSLNEELRLLQAQGAAQDVILAKQNEISAAKAKQAQIDIDAYQTQLTGINALINKDDEYLTLKNELFNLQTGQTTLSYEELNNLVQLKQEEIAGYEAGNDKFKTRKELTDKIAAAQALLNTAINDPKVAAAQAATEKSAKATADELERQKKIRTDINALLSSITSDVANLKSINELLRGISNVDLTDTYTNWKRLTDAYWNTKDVMVKLAKEVQQITKLKKYLTAEDVKQLDSNIALIGYYNNTVEIINKLIDKNKEYLNAKDMVKKVTEDEILLISTLSMKYDMLANSLYEYQRLDFNPYGNVDKSEEAVRNLELFRQRIEIIKRENENKVFSLFVDKEQIDDEKKLLELRNTEILSKNEALIKKVEDDRKNNKFSVLTPVEDLVVKEYYDNIDKISDYARQSNDKQFEMDKLNANSKLELEKVTNDTLVAMELDALSSKMSAQEEYYNKVQTLASNVYGFMDQLQNEQIIKSKDLRNVLLVAQKGAEIAQIVINTTRENSRLKQQAAQYSTNAALYGGLAAALAVTDPVASASYAAAAGAYTAGAAKSAAQIPINWGIAGVGIASILATTLTSWNKSGDSGSGGGGAGAGGAAAAQFNIMGASGNNQLAAAIGAQQNQPVNAYVVGSDMTTQQALDRNRISNATFL